MAREAFKRWKPSSESQRTIEQANEIIAEYIADGFSLTLRQLYYQFVARDLIPNQQAEYKKLGEILSRGRLAGMVDWEAIEDRTRNLEKQPTWESPSELVEACAQQFRVDKWDRQPYRIEVWPEKEALVGVVEPVCRDFSIPYFACRGSVSQSEQWRAGKRFAEYVERGQKVVVLHLGDHDPSGIDMTRDNQERLWMFSDPPAPTDVEVVRIALNMDQIRRYKPPPNPAKTSDSNFAAYAAKFGEKCWELDSLSPRVIDALIREHVERYIDRAAFDDAVAEEEEGREALGKIADRFEDVAKFLEKRR